MYTNLIIACFALFFTIVECSLLQAQSQTSPSAPRQITQVEWEQVHTLTVAAMNELYNLRFSEGEQRCNEVIKLAPRDPRGHFFRAVVYYYRNFVYREKSDYERFLSLSARAIQVCEAILKDNPKDSKAMFYMGGLEGYRGLLYANNQELSKAVWEAKKGYDRLKEALEADPNNVDAQMGLGLFSYMISLAPQFLQPALKLAGLKGDRIGGLKMLENVAAKGVYARYEAMFWLSNFYRGDYEQQYERAAYHLDNLMKQFPANDFYQNSYGTLLLNNLRKADKAITQFQSVVAKAQSGTQVNAIALGVTYLRLGTAFMYKNKFLEAEQWLQKCLAHNADTAQIRDANASLGLCKELQGLRSAAVPYYQKSLGSSTSAERIKKPLTPHEIMLTKQAFLFNAGEYDASAALGEQVISSQNVAASVRAQAQYWQGRAAFEKGDFTKAEERLFAASTVTIADESWFAPQVQYRLGLAQVKLGKKAEAKGHFEQALTHNNYRNEDFVKKLIQKELARLKNS
jgi:tetratricopeptide (TPR) repeat protein